MNFSSRSAVWPLVFSTTIVIGLAVDQFFTYGQWVVNLFVIGLFVLTFALFDKKTRILFLVCFFLALAGEIFLCKISGLYTYREENLPWFVPPGHVLLYATGLWLVPRAPKNIHLYVLAFFVPYACLAWAWDFDRFSVILFALVSLMMFMKQMRALFCVMFLLALVMEIYGTWLGNWVWESTFAFGFWEVSQANPPFASGVLYCGLDFLTQRITGLVPDHRTES